MKNKVSLQLAVALFALPFCFQPAAHGQSLWRDDASRPIFADKRACAVGDILTVVVQEITTASKNNETKTEKTSGLSAAVNTFFYPGFLTFKNTMPAVDYKSSLKHDGNGAINNSEAIVAHVAVKVVDVLPNRNLVVEGRRETAFSSEHQTIVLRGIVRPENIGADNTILSYNIADATVTITGKGTVTDTTRKGWFTMIWDKVNPF